ncbi:MAG: SDR family oxidoreductase [Balneolales bacterium]|nr:SDR family oxidoreductase [Balneolales bacterium]
MFDKKTLHGKTAVITGGGSGLGLAMAEMFATLGARVIICGRTEEKLKKAVLSIKEKAASANDDVEIPEPDWFSVDVRDYEAVELMANEIEKRYGLPDILVNNAAGNFLSASENLSKNAFKTIVDIVLHGTFNCTRIFGSKWIEAGKAASVLNIVTTYTESGSSFVLPSACAKAGVYAMTNSLAYEWATYNIRLNSIAPGPFPTEGAWSRLLPDEKMEKSYLKMIPAGRYGRHEELANLAVFLVSDLSPYITGECVTIDGGERLKSGQFNFITQMAERPQLKQFFSMMKPSRK